MGAYNIPTILQSIKEDIYSGKITLIEAAKALHEANYIPYVDEARAASILGLQLDGKLCWRIIPCSHGGVTATYGIYHEGSVSVGFKPGFTMPAFVVYYSAHFDTEKKAVNHVKKNPVPMKNKSGF